MKGNKKILVIAVLLLLIAVSYGTYAIYRTSVAGDATVTAAKWDIEFKDGDTAINNLNVTFTEDDCKNNAHVKNGVIAPGARCTKTITVDAKNTEVDVVLTAETGTPKADGSAVPTAANQFTASATVTTTPAGGVITYDATEKTATVVVELQWGGEEGADSYDPADTGLQGKKITVPVTLIAKQKTGA